MIKRTIEISREPAHLSVRLRQLQIQHGGETVASIPCEDIGVLVVDHPASTYTHSALAALAESHAAVVICGSNHVPAAMLVPLSDHTEVVWRIRDQINAGKPLRKRLWRQIVRAKITAQAANLAAGNPARAKLIELAREVRSGDPRNCEAQAAKIYWAHWQGDRPFRRDYDAKGGPNSFLNYGYAIVRAALARAIVAAGLSPAIGLHHSNRSNGLCLADDLIEPLRPIVDERVREMTARGYETLTQEAKADLLGLLTVEVSVAGAKGPFMVGMHRYVGSLVRCLGAEAKLLEVPHQCS